MPQKRGLLQAVDPCAKILAFLILMIFSGCTSSITTLIVLTAVPLFYGAASGIPMKDFFRRGWLTIPLIVLLFFSSRNQQSVSRRATAFST
jgi:energy-coupling factor transporter transmembrane protein EcfT